MTCRCSCPCTAARPGSAHSIRCCRRGSIRRGRARLTPDALREHLGHDKLILLGWSYGGVLALEYALRHQQHLDALILLATLPAMDYPEVIEANARQRGTPEEVEEFLGALADPSDDDADVRALFSKYLKWYFHRLMGDGLRDILDPRMKK